MAEESLTRESLESILKLVKTSEETDVLRETCEWAINQLMEVDVEGQIGAKKNEHSEERETHRNGYRYPKTPYETRVGGVKLKIPKLRDGTYYPDWLLERQQPTEQALLGVILEAYINGVSTRTMNKVVEETGLDGIDKSKVSRINQQLDERVKAFQSRRLDGPYAYVYFDATQVKVREDGQVQPATVVIGFGVNSDGYREILGFAMGAVETQAFWLDFLRSLRRRGLTGVRMVSSDAHEGLKMALNQVFEEAIWNRCRTHFANNLVSYVPESREDEVRQRLNLVYEQPDYEEGIQKAQKLVSWFDENGWEKAANCLDEAKEDILAHMHFPRDHWRRLRTTNPIERLNREVKRRTNSVGIFPHRKAVRRLAGMVLVEQHEAWLNGRRYFSKESMQNLLKQSESTNKKVVKIS
jgi:transposase-like protein